MLKSQITEDQEAKEVAIPKLDEKLLPGYSVEILVDTDVKGTKVQKPDTGFRIVQKLNNGNFAIPNKDGKMLEVEAKNLKHIK